MKVSYNWLKDYIKTNLSPEKISEILTDTGLEVEGLEKVETIKGGLKGVIIGEVITKTKHPDADKLNITTVNIGQDEPLQIVCGAPNVEAGQKVVVVTVGSTIYPTSDLKQEGFKIKKSKIRGVESYGMICAEDELGLGNSHEGIMVLPNDAKVGTPAAEYFKIENDYVIEIGLTPNRSDALGHIGVARDIKAYLNFHNKENLNLIKPKVNSLNLDGTFKINIENYNDCPRFAATILKNITVKPSPEWLQNRLRVIGISPINNVVDITNYVMHETGNPLHAYDFKVVGDELNIRRAKKGEKIVTLDGIERTLDTEDLLVCNSKEPLCIAGVLGGEHSGVKEQTTELLLEAAYFNPVVIRKTAKRHALNTDASFRFERGVDPDQVIYAMERAVDLLIKYANAEIVEAEDNYPHPIEDKIVEFSMEKCRQLIGHPIADEEIAFILKELDIQIDLCNDKEFCYITIPAYRVDVTRQADIVEEVLRIYGYNQIPNPDKLNTSISYQPKPNRNKLYNLISDLLVDNGYYEIMNNSLTSSKFIEKSGSSYLKPEHNVVLLNPLSNELDVMRQTLLFGGLQSIAYNQNRQNPNLKLFEFGKIYQKYSDSNVSEHKYVETQKLGIWLSGLKETENWASSKDKVSFYTLKGIVEAVFTKIGINKNIQVSSLTNNLFEDGYQIKIAKKIVGEIGWIKPSVLKLFKVKNKVFYADLNWDQIIELTVMNKIKFTPLPKTQFVRRDFSLLLDENITFSQIQDIAFKTDHNILKEVGLFDVYEGKNLEKGKKSYAVSFIFQDKDKTLKDETVDHIMSKIRQKLEQQLNAELR